MQDAVTERDGALGGPLAEHTRHLAVIPEDVSLEAVNVAGERPRTETTQQQRAEPAALEAIGDDKRDLPDVIARLVETGDSHDVAVVFDHYERLTFAVVNGGEACDLLWGQLRVRREEAVVAARLAQALVERDERRGVGGRDRPDMHTLMRPDVGLA